MPVVSKSAIWNNSWRTIYDLINSAKSGYTIPIITLASSHSDISVTSKANYPVVVVEPTESTGEDRPSFKERGLGLSVTVSVQTRNLPALDSLCADISNTLESSEDSLKGNNIYDIGIAGTAFSFYEHGKIKVYERSMTYGFVSNYAVS